MKTIVQKRRLYAALIAALAYIAACLIGNALSPILNTDYMGICLTLAVLLTVYLIVLPKAGISLGFARPKKGSAINTMFYLPPVVVVIFSYGAYDESLTGNAALCILVAAVFAAILQESIFRAVLFSALRQRLRLRGCISLAALGFCLDALLFPVADDSPLQLGIRLVCGFACGIMAAALAYLTQSVVPGTLFHTLLLIAQLMTVETDDISSTGPAAAILIICLLYSYFLYTRSQKMDKAALK